MRTMRPNGEIRSACPGSISWQKCSLTAIHPQLDLCLEFYSLLKKVGKLNQSSLRNSNALMQGEGRGGHGKARLWGWGGQSLAGFTIKLIAVGSSRALALGLLASLPILSKPGRVGEGADWTSKGPRQSFAPDSASSWPIHMSFEVSGLGPDPWL